MFRGPQVLLAATGSSIWILPGPVVSHKSPQPHTIQLHWLNSLLYHDTPHRAGHLPPCFRVELVFFTSVKTQLDMHAWPLALRPNMCHCDGLAHPRGPGGAALLPWSAPCSTASEASTGDMCSVLQMRTCSQFCGAASSAGAADSSGAGSVAARASSPSGGDAVPCVAAGVSGADTQAAASAAGASGGAAAGTMSSVSVDSSAAGSVEARVCPSKPGMFPSLSMISVKQCASPTQLLRFESHSAMLTVPSPSLSSA